MSSGTIDVHKTRTFGVEKYLLRQWPFFAGMLLLGSFVLWARYDENGNTGDIVIGLIAVAGSLAYLGGSLLRRRRPGKPLLELSSDGILYRFGRNKEFRIPWTEVQGLRRIDIRVFKGPNLYDVPAVLVSQDFFDANAPFRTRWGRVRREWFIPRGDKVQVAIHHDVLSVQPDELWNEIEMRWRVLGGHPDAPPPTS